MTINETQTKTGSLVNYTGYALLLFCWYFFDNRLSTLTADLPQSTWLNLVDWGRNLLLWPLLFAGLFGGIYSRLVAAENDETPDGFFHGIRVHFLRFLGANLLSFVVYLIVMVVVLAARGVDPSQVDQHKLLTASIVVPLAALNLFWFAAIVAERRVFRGLLRALETLILHPLSLAVGLLWGVISFADSFGIEFPTGPLALPSDALRAAVVAVARIGVMVFACSVYARTASPVTETPEQAAPPESMPGEGLIKASFGFSFVSFLPVFHLLALTLGILALLRRKQFVLKAAAACVLGGFFTLYYALMVAGWLISRSTPSPAPGYEFLTQVNSRLQPQVSLFEKGSFEEAQQQLEQGPADATRSWTIDTALALAKLEAGDRAAALKDFRAAAKKKPQRGEFYYYYGMTLLKDGQDDQAAAQFQTALSYDPNLDGAKRYAALLDSTYTPSPLVSGSFYILILLVFLFPLHEYGHAFAAWKLGDDTPQKLGRLTLNPIAHLEIFGSILLPAILIFQQSEFVFGWARPVPVDTRNFKDPRRDHMLVSFAGPAMNLLVAMLALFFLGSLLLGIQLIWPQTLALHLAEPFSGVALVGPPATKWLLAFICFLKQLFYTSLILGCFNLLPIPPLDGSWIISGWLPQRLRELYEKSRRFGSVLFLLLIVTSVFDYILLVPIVMAWGALQFLISAMGLG